MARPASDGEPREPGQPVSGTAGEGLEPLEPQELPLDEVLRAYEQPINEEQAWAVCYQCCRSLRSHPPPPRGHLPSVREPAAIRLHRDGTVSMSASVTVTASGDRNNSSSGGGTAPADSKMKISPPLCTERQVVQSLGFAIYRALDWGLDENEERELSRQLEQLIDQMANNDSEGTNGTTDEGYSGQDDEEEGDAAPRPVSTFEQVMKACTDHLVDRNEADAHFQAVCKALFAETLELQTFLVKIKDAKETMAADWTRSVTVAILPPPLLPPPPPHCATSSFSPGVPHILCLGRQLGEPPPVGGGGLTEALLAGGYNIVHLTSPMPRLPAPFLSTISKHSNMMDVTEDSRSSKTKPTTYFLIPSAWNKKGVSNNEAKQYTRPYVDGGEVETVECFKFLGINITSNLPRTSPTKAMAKKAQLQARLWVQLMRDLRHGVKLKKVEEKQYNPLPTEYHLTPFEMLMQDIKTQKYKLRKVMVDGNISPCVKKNAHELILEFIRSRPPLKPVSERNLRPKPQKPRSLHERILEEIKSERKLRPVQIVGRKKNKETTFGSLPCLVLACSDELKTTSCIDLSVPDAMGSAQRPRPRVLLKAPTLAEMDEMCISEEEDSPDGGMRRVISSPVPLKRDRSFSEHDLIRLQAELALSQSESAYLSSKDSRTKLYSGTDSVPGDVSPHKAEQNKEMWPVEPQRSRSSSARGDILRTSRDTSGTLSNVTKRQLMQEFSHPVETLALTVEEIINVRKVLVKAEMEKFLQNKDLYNSLKKGKVCCCCKTKFPLFSWPSACLFCKRSVCGSCRLKIKIPSKKMAHIPVYTLGFENIQAISQTKMALAKGFFQSQSLRNLSNRSVEQEFPHLYAHGCSFKDVCAECTKFVADVINSSRKSMDLLNNTPSRRVQSMYVCSTRS
ncbi:protein spire homolog 2 [Rhinoraja longicauda]